MSYPNQIDSFVEKLNKNEAGYVIEDEILVINNGQYEGELAHDNVKNESVMIFTSPQMAGERIFNFFLSVPADAPWKRIIKVFSATPKVYITYETLGDQVEAEDINQVQDSIVATQVEVNRYKGINDQAVQELITKKADKTYVDSELLKKYDKERVYTKEEVLQKIEDLIGSAPQTLDTLAEIADALNNDPNFASTMMTELAKKVDKVSGKGLSDENYTLPEKNKLAGIEAEANKYIHPSSHPASIIVQDANNRFVTDVEKAAWNGKAPGGYGLGVYLSGVHATNSNNATTTGMYYATSADPNKPTGVADGALFVMAYSAVWVTQLYMDWRTNKHYTRVCNNGTWSTWIEVTGGSGAKTWNDLKGVT